jgi:hypothetical protein
MKEGGRAERRFDIRIDAANFAVYAALKSNKVQGALLSSQRALAAP